MDSVFVSHLLDEFVSDSKSPQQLAELEMKNYIQSKGEWQVEIKKDNEEQPEDPTVDNALPLKVINNYYLGNILKTLFAEIYKQEEQKQTAVQNKYFVSLLGLEFSGKTSIAAKIKEKFGFNVIFIDSLI